MSGLKVSEAEWQEQVIQLAELHGWRVNHVRRAVARTSARHGKQWVTPTSITGWPDLTAYRPDVDLGGELIFVELKTDRGQLTDDQRTVLADLMASGQEVHVWRPRDWGAVHERLTRHRTTQETPRAL